MNLFEVEIVFNSTIRIVLNINYLLSFVQGGFEC